MSFPIHWNKHITAKTANALESLQSCTKPSIWGWEYYIQWRHLGVIPYLCLKQKDNKNKTPPIACHLITMESTRVVLCHFGDIWSADSLTSSGAWTSADTVDARSGSLFLSGGSIFVRLGVHMTVVIVISVKSLKICLIHNFRPQDGTYPI